MAFITEYIVHIDGDDLSTRSAAIEFDEASGFTSDCPDDGPLHVASGLALHDTAVVLSIPYLSNPGSHTMTEVGYWVTHVDEDNDGSGILVGMDLVDANPLQWGSDRVNRAFYTMKSNGFTAATFGFASLKEYFANRS